MSLEDLVEPTLKGALLVTGIVVTLVGLAPIAVGVALVSPYWYWKWEQEAKQAAIENQRRMEHEAKLYEINKQREEDARKIEEAEKLKERLAEQAHAKTEEEEKPKEVTFDKLLYLASEFTYKQREVAFARGYRLLKVSPFGKSGAQYFWVWKRWNESKEHAFFCYLIESLLSKKVENLTMNISNGPDVQFSYTGKSYCFDVETGSNLKRNPEYVAKKFSHYREKFDHCFIFVTKKKLKYSYSKHGKVVTRFTLKQTIRNILIR